jgi:PAS domain S-box-containing protein
MHVLLIEDNPGDALLVQTYLEELDADVTLDHVTRLSEAKSRLEVAHYDALLVDLSLPDTDGVETVRRVQAIAPHLPIVVMSGLGDHATALTAVQIGAQDYLVKGEAQGNVILRTLRYSVERSRLARELEASRARAEVLSALGEALQSARSPLEVFRLASERIGEVLGAQGMALWHCPKNQLELRWSWGSGASVLDDTLREELTRALSKNLGWSERPNGSERVAAIEPVRDSIGNAIAALLVTRRARHAWLEPERDLLRRAAATMGLALERADLIARLEVNNANLEVKTSLALEAARMVSFDWDIGTDRLTLSSNASEVLGSGAGNAYSSLRGHEYVHPDDLERHREIVNTAISTQTPYRSVLRLWHDERHEYLWIEEYGVVRIGAQGDTPSLSGVAQDITDRKRAEEKLQESQQRLELALESAGMGTWDWQLDTGMVLWNGHNDIIFGFPKGTTSLRFPEVMQRVHEVDRVHLETALNQALEGQDLDTEFRVVWPDGTVRNVLTRGRVVRNARGNNISLTGTTVDVTQIKRAEAMLRRVNEAQKRFVSDAAHELRAPLTSIQGNLQLLLRYSNMPLEDRNAALSDAHREAARLGRLVTDLLALARGDSGEGLRRESLHLHELVSEAVRQAQHLAQHHRLEIGEIQPCTIEGDRDRLKQLTLILLENALKYTPRDGQVSVRLTCDPDWSEFTVTDSGVGISAEDLPHVFDRFYRADKGRARGDDPGGTGLGLPIAQWIVAQHGGRIDLQSQIGVGTTVTVRLPIAP